MKQAIHQIERATHFLDRLEARIQKPFAIIDEQKIRGFRFAKPGVKHFIVLNVARSLSLLNSMILLRDSGYKGEFAILARALLENTTKLYYVVAGLSIAGIDKKPQNSSRDSFLTIRGTLVGGHVTCQ